jgi:hypothetical protein
MLALAIEVRHLARIVAGAGDLIDRHRRLDAREIARVELQVHRRNCVFELLAPPRTNNRHDIVAA